MKLSNLPAVLAEIAEVAGLSAALAIARFRGGSRTHFPATAPDDHWLPVLVGREAADKLCAHFRVGFRGGITLDVPLGPTKLYGAARLQALALREDGASVAETARRVGVTTRAVEQWTAKARAEADRDARRRRIADAFGDAPEPPIEALPEKLVHRPEILAEIAEVAGMPVALALSESGSRRSTDFPLPPPDDHWLVEAVGRETAEALGRYFAGVRREGVAFALPFPTPFLRAVVQRRALALVEAGRSAADVAHEMSVTAERIEKWCAAARAARKKEAARAASVEVED